MTETETEEMAGNGRFSELLAISVAAGKSVKAGAAELNCSERHAYRLAATADFRTMVSEIRTAAISAACGELTSAAVLAVRKLVALLDDPQFGLQAAKAILASVAPLSELGELRSRLDALEAQS